MNALVDYGSSSDEEQGSLPSPKTNIPQLSKDVEISNQRSDPSPQYEEDTVEDQIDEDEDFSVDRIRPKHLHIGSTSSFRKNIPSTVDSEISDPQKALFLEVRNQFLKQGIISLDDEQQRLKENRVNSDPDLEMMIQERLTRFLQLRENGVQLNAKLETMHDFKNPSIMSKMIEYLGLSEHGTNAPSGKFDSHGLHKKTFVALMDKSEQKEAEPVKTIPTATTKASAPSSAGGPSATQKQMDVAGMIQLAKERAARFAKSSSGR